MYGGTFKNVNNKDDDEGKVTKVPGRTQRKTKRTKIRGERSQMIQDGETCCVCGRVKGLNTGFKGRVNWSRLENVFREEPVFFCNNTCKKKWFMG
jgi:hypothetical protein